MGRRILAGLLGGVAAFVWSSISHMALPLGEAGVSQLSNESAVLDTLKREVPAAGLYLFPAPTDSSAEAQAELMERYQTGPSGVLVYLPPGRTFSFPKLLGVELVSTLLAGMIAACVLMRTPLTVGRGALLGAGLGLFTWLSISLSYWNWYDFPTNYVLAEGADQLIGWILGGAVIAMVASRRRA
jgi:hypothetical protein